MPTKCIRAVLRHDLDAGFLSAVVLLVRDGQRWHEREVDVDDALDFRWIVTFGHGEQASVGEPRLGLLKPLLTCVCENILTRILRQLVFQRSGVFRIGVCCFRRRHRRRVPAQQPHLQLPHSTERTYPVPSERSSAM